MSINKERTIITQGAHARLVGIFSFILIYENLSLLVKSFEDEIQLFRDCVDTIKG